MTTLVQIFLRGGCDTLSIVPPIAGADRKVYEEARPNLKIPVSGNRAALPLAENLGFHPAAKPFHDLFTAKKLAVIQATGLTRPTRSHFDAQMAIETGGLDGKGPRDGWLTRYLGIHAPSAATVPTHEHRLSAVALGVQLPSSFFSCEKVVVINNLNGFNIDGGHFQEAQRASLRRMYALSGSTWMNQTASETLEAIDELENLRGDYQPVAGVEYPKGDVGNKLKTLAQLLKAGYQLDAVTVDMGGWDTHKNQGGGGEGLFANQLGQLAQAVAAFQKDLEDPAAADKKISTRIAIYSEFGRRLKENGNGGTDHGHGGFMLVLGEGVNGGRVFGRWPGLATEQLFERADLQVTTDYRQVLTELALGEKSTALAPKLFPGFSAGPMLGLIKST